MATEDIMQKSRVFHIVGNHADACSFIRDCSYISEIIDDLGFETLLFNNPHQYIDYIDNPKFEKPIAAFVNVSLSLVNGYERLNRISTLVPDMKFVVISREPETKSEYIDLACMYLKMPFSPDKLIGIVSNLVRCHIFSLSDGTRCASLDDRKYFPLHDWSCPGF